MKKTFTLMLAISAIVWAACSTHSQPKNFLKAKGHHIVDGHGDTVILRGMGLGGWMLQEGYMFRLGFIGQQYRIREHIEEVIGVGETERFYADWRANHTRRSEEHTSELQSLMRLSYAVFCLN